MSKQVSLTWEEFETQFKPIRNVFSPDDNQKMYETYGAEGDLVNSTNSHNVWTYLDIDYGSVITNGYNYVNRIGYFITEVPWEEDTEYEVDLTMDTCDNCSATFEDAGYGEDGLCESCYEDSKDN